MGQRAPKRDETETEAGAVDVGGSEIMGFEYYDYDIEDIVDFYINDAMDPRFKDAFSREIYFDNRKRKVVIKFYFSEEEKK